MSKVYDHDTKQWVVLDDAEVTEKVASGRYAFEDGIDIPVVSPNGEIGTVPSKNAHKAFNKGYRWATREDSERDAERKNKQVLVDRYDDPTKAFAAGTLRGVTLGASDIIIPAMAGSASEDVNEALGHLKEQNPISSTAGLVAGSLVGGGLNPAALGGKAMQKLGAGVGTSPITKSIIGGVAEGAFYGLGDGISEAALGDAEGVVDNMAAVGQGMVTGALFGGGIGGLMGVAKPAVIGATGLAGKAIRGTQKLGEKALQKATGRAVRASLSAKGEAELARIAGDLAENSEIRQAYIDGGAAAVRKVVKENKKLSQQATTAMKKEAKSIKAALKDVPKKQRAEIDRVIAESGDNVLEGRQRLYYELEAEYGDFMAAVSGSSGKSRHIGTIFNDAETAYKKLLSKSATDKRAAALGHQIRELLQSSTTPNIFKATGRARVKALKSTFTDGQEHRLALEIRRLVDDAVYGGRKKAETSYFGPAKKTVEILRGRMNNYVKESKRFGKAQKALDEKYHAYSNLDRMVSSRIAKKSGGVLKRDDKKIMNTLLDPREAGHVSIVLDNVDQFAPEMKAFAKQFQSASEKRIAMKNIQAKLREYGALADHEQLNISSLEALFRKIGGIPEGRIADLKHMKQVIEQAGDMTPLSKYMLLKRTLGEPVEQEIKAIAHMEPAFVALDKIEKLGIHPSQLEQSVAQIARFKGAKLPLGGVGTLAGGLAFGMPGAIAGAGIDIARTAKQNPMKLLEALTTAERVSRKGANLLDKALARTGKAMVSRKVERAALVGKIGGQDRKKRIKKKETKKLIKKLQETADVGVLADQVQNQVAALDGAPGVQQAVMGRMISGVSFLSEKVPRSPMAETSIFPEDEWEPSSSEVAKFERYAEAVDNPITVLDNITKGTVTTEEVEALKTVYPGIYSRLQETIINAITEEGAKVPYDTRIMLGTLFDVPTDPSLAGEFLVSLQSTFDDENGQAQAPQRQQGPQREIDVNPEQYNTLAANITNRGLT